jgi:hypothetical protein
MYGDERLFLGVSIVLNLEEVLPVAPALVALKLSMCNEPPPNFASVEEELLSALSGPLAQAIAISKLNDPNINNRFPIRNRTAGFRYGFNKMI